VGGAGPAGAALQPCAKTVARPPVDQPAASGTCTYNEQSRRTTTATRPDQTAPARVGNPALLAQQNSTRTCRWNGIRTRTRCSRSPCLQTEGKVGQSTGCASRRAVRRLRRSRSGDRRLATSTSTTRPGKRRGDDPQGRRIQAPNGVHLPAMVSALHRPGRQLHQAAFGAVLGQYRRPDHRRPAAAGARVEVFVQPGAVVRRRQVSARVAVQAWRPTSTVSRRAARTRSTTTRMLPAAVPRSRRTTRVRRTSATRPAIIDAKIGYKYNDHIEFFVEGRNLGKATTSNSQGQYSQFADGTPSLLDYATPAAASWWV
jgi:hypothetical protein